MARIVLGEKYKKSGQALPLTNSTGNGRNASILEDIKNGDYASMHLIKIIQ